MKFITTNELSSFLGISIDSNIQAIADGAEEYVLSKIHYVPVNSITETFEGPASQVNLSQTYIASIEAMLLNNEPVTPAYNLMTGEIYITLSGGDQFSVTYYPTLEVVEEITTTTRYALLKGYPIKYIKQVTSNSSVISDYSLMGGMVLKLPKEGIYTVTYRIGDKLPNDIKMALLVLIKYWYRNYKDSSYGIESYKIGDVSVKFTSYNTIPFEVDKILEKYSLHYLSWFGGLV